MITRTHTCQARTPLRIAASLRSSQKVSETPDAVAPICLTTQSIRNVFPIRGCHVDAAPASSPRNSFFALAGKLLSRCRLSHAFIDTDVRFW